MCSKCDQIIYKYVGTYAAYSMDSNTIVRNSEGLWDFLVGPTIKYCAYEAGGLDGVIEKKEVSWESRLNLNQNVWETWQMVNKLYSTINPVGTRGCESV